MEQIRFEGPGDPESALAVMKTRTGSPLQKTDIQNDVTTLWRVLKVAVKPKFAPGEDGGVVVTIVVPGTK